MTGIVSTAYSDMKDSATKPSHQILSQKTVSGPLVISKKKISFSKVVNEMEYIKPSASVVLNSADSITFQGKLFYDDLRTGGRFEWRKDENGNTGAATTWNCTPKGTSNYLGALDVVADFYEVDLEGSGSSCSDTEHIGSATVGPDGSYSVTFSDLASLDNCSSDGDNKIQLAVSFRLRFCNLADDSTPDRCFSVGASKDDPYILWRSDASVENPLEIPTRRTGTYDMGTSYFQTSNSAGDPEDMYAQAANYYASLVDTTRVWHREGDVPFGTSYGEMFLIFPSDRQEDRESGAACSTYDATEMDCVDPEPDDDDITASCPSPEKWTNGEVIMHEYGHVIHDRAWNGSTGDCGDCPGGQYSRGESCGSSCSWSATSLEYPHPAFSEGWANFVSKVVRGECEGDFDDNATSDGEVMPSHSAYDSTPYEPEEGEAYARNVTKLLCDWYDSQSDDDADRAGNGDHFAASSLYSVWYNLNGMWDYYKDERDNGLILCHYVNYYLYKRKGADEVGDETHEEYMSSIADLAYNNGVSCDLPSPQGDLSISRVELDGGFAKFSAVSGKTLSSGKSAKTSPYKNGKFKVTVKNKNYPYAETVSLNGPGNVSRDVDIDKTSNSTVTKTFNVSVLTDSSGMPDSSNQTLTWTLDPDSEITDTDRSNNTYSVELKPDYKAGIGDVKQTCKGVDTVKSSLCTLYVSCGVSNNGFWDGVKTSTVSLKVSGKGMEDKTATQTVPSLGVDASELVGFTLMLAKNTNTTITITCAADAGNELDELDESDNQASHEFRVTSGKSASQKFQPVFNKKKTEDAD